MLFSVVVPVHDMQDYLAECLDSILGQDLDDPADLEVIAVDDASSDTSPTILAAYAASDQRLTIVRLDTNVGLGRARNAGMYRATGDYLLFVDSDDSLAAGSLGAIAERIAATDRPDLVVYDFVRTYASGAHVRDDLSARLAAGDPAPFELSARPGYLQLFPVVWNKAYRRDFLDDGGFEFPAGYYEDIPFTYPVLMAAGRIVALDRICYRYRQRTGNILRTADRRQLDFFTQFGLVFDYLDAHPGLDPWRIPLYDRLTRHAPWILEIRDRISPALRRDFFAAAAQSFRRNRPAGFVAPSRTAALKIRLIERGDYRAFRLAQLGNFAARFVANRRRPTRPELDPLLDRLVEDGRWSSTETPLTADESEVFHTDLAAAVQRAGVDGIRARTDLPDQLRQALLVGILGESPPPPRRHHDRLRRLARVRYFVGAVAPGERVTLAGDRVQPVYAKWRSIDYLGRTMLRERIVWLPADAELTLDGAATTSAPPAPNSLRARVRRLRTVLNPSLVRTILGDLRIRLAARTPGARIRYRNAWVLMDRDSEAQDNAEALYRHLQSARPDVNAWFVLRRDSVDWPRLERAGFHLLEFGSLEHYAALLHCVHLISSQVDTYVNQPFWRRFLGTPRWRFTFLQHGVTQNDLSRWINDKPIDLVLTATPDEQRGLVADGTPYVLTALDAQLTGFTRHDRLHTLAESVTDPATLLVMPTWRQQLLGAREHGNRRDLQADFWSSEFALAWRALLESERLRELCARTGWTLTFVPHPNLQDYLDSSPLPAHVRALRFRDLDVQRVLADAAVLVTDYSSLAFEAAYLERPVVYYQFDSASFFAGNHVVRRGTWSYLDQGFGPVTGTADAAIDALTAVADGVSDPGYARRARDTFPFRDGRCCDRAVTAIEALRRPADAAAIVRRAAR